MFISFVKAIERKSGKLKTLAEMGTATYDQSKINKVQAAADAFDAPTKEGASLRQTYSHVICVIMNKLRSNREYADAELEALRINREAVESAERAAQEKAKADLDAARAELEKAKAALIASGGTIEGDENLKAQVEKLEAERDELKAKLEAPPVASNNPPSTEIAEITENSSAPSAPSTGDDQPPPDN